MHKEILAEINAALAPYGLDISKVYRLVEADKDPRGNLAFWQIVCAVVLTMCEQKILSDGRFCERRLSLDLDQFLVQSTMGQHDVVWNGVSIDNIINVLNRTVQQLALWSDGADYLVVDPEYSFVHNLKMYFASLVEPAPEVLADVRNVMERYRERKEETEAELARKEAQYNDLMELVSDIGSDEAIEILRQHRDTTR